MAILKVIVTYSIGVLSVKPLNILLADDSQSVGAFVSDYLRSAGHTVTHVASGEQAVEVFRSLSFDLVLMDVLMPGIGGLEAVRQIKAIRTTNWVPIIIITALGAEEDVLDRFMAGADDYFVKPINSLTLDIRIRSMARIAALQRSANAVIDNVVEGIVLIDGRGRISRFNKAAEQIFGYTPEEVLGHNVKMLMPPPFRDEHDGYLTSYQETGQAKIIGSGRMVTGLRKNGETFPMHLGVSEAATPDGKFFIGLIRDETAEQRMRSDIEYLATHDVLTALPNRSECWKHLQARYAIRHAGVGPADCTVFYCDLDGFKEINDQHGHAVGDLVLKEATRRMREILFVRDFLGRVGGDEFLIVIDGSMNDELSMALAGRIIESVSRPMATPEGSYQIGASIGIAHAVHYPESVQALVNAADQAMYAAKRLGKGRAAVA